MTHKTARVGREDNQYKSTKNLNYKKCSRLEGFKDKFIVKSQISLPKVIWSSKYKVVILQKKHIVVRYASLAKIPALNIMPYN